MPKQQRIFQRGDVYYHRVTVPVDLVKTYGGKRDIIKSLLTKDLREAKRLGRIRDVKIDEEFEQHREAKSGKTAEVVITSASIERACGAKIQEIIESDFVYRAEIFAKAEAG